MTVHPQVPTLIAYADYLRALGKRPATIESYCADARDFLAYLAAHRMSVEMVVPETMLAYQEYLLVHDHDRANSIRRKVIGVRGFFRFLAAEKTLSDTPFELLPIPERHELLPSELQLSSVRDLLTKVDSQPPSLKQTRDLCILKLLAVEGLKAQELTDLRWAELMLGTENSALVVRGPRSRVISLAAETGDCLNRYRRLLHDLIPEAMRLGLGELHLCAHYKVNPFTLRRMSRHGLKGLIYELGKAAGLEHLNTELLRHYAISERLLAGEDAEGLMRHLGLRQLGVIGKHLGRQRHAEGQHESSL